ncbi:unnamed protein product [Caenorhabditis nigoni]
MAKRTKKPKAKQPTARVGRPRTRDVKDKAREVGATSSTPSTSATKPSQKHRLAMKKAEAAVKKSHQREEESQEVTSKRRRLDALSKKKARKEETEEEHKKRTSSNRERTSRARSEETEDQHHRRTSSNAARTSRARSEETDEKRGRRKSVDAGRTSKARSEESEAETLRRRDHNKEHMAVTRATESLEASESRKEADRKRHSSHVTEDCGIARKDVRVEENYLGTMSVQCSSCGALHYKGEQPKSKKFNTCCRHGLIQLPMFDNFPKELRDLFTSSTSESAEFLKNIRTYNNSLAMGSMVANVDTPKGGGPYTYRLHEQVFHVTGALHPEPGQEHLCAQVFILDTEEAAAQLANRKTKILCSKDLYKKLIDLLHMYNPFVKSYKMMREKEEEEELLASAENRDVREVKMVFRSNKNLNPNSSFMTPKMLNSKKAEKSYIQKGLEYLTPFFKIPNIQTNDLCLMVKVPTPELDDLLPVPFYAKEALILTYNFEKMVELLLALKAGHLETLRLEFKEPTGRENWNRVFETDQFKQAQLVQINCGLELNLEDLMSFSHLKRFSCGLKNIIGLEEILIIRDIVSTFKDLLWCKIRYHRNESPEEIPEEWFTYRYKNPESNKTLEFKIEESGEDYCFIDVRNTP